VSARKPPKDIVFRGWAAIVSGPRSSWILPHTLRQRSSDTKAFFDAEDLGAGSSISIVRVVATAKRKR
jgi:hypothetical protein